MAVQLYTKDLGGAAGMGDGSLIRVRWNTMANGDTGSPLPWGEWADRTAHFWTTNSAGTASTLGAGGSVSFEGSNDYDPNTGNAGTWTVLTDQNGSVMTYTAIGLKQCTESPLWVRPHVTAGDGTTACNVVASLRRIQPMISH